MVTIFDMVTGEILADEAPATPAAPLDAAGQEEQALLMPRLQPVETNHESTDRATLPADLAGVNAAVFVASQRG